MPGSRPVTVNVSPVAAYESISAPVESGPSGLLLQQFSR